MSNIGITNKIPRITRGICALFSCAPMLAGLVRFADFHTRIGAMPIGQRAEAVRPAPLDIVLLIVVAGAAAKPLDDFIFSFAHKQAFMSTALNATIL